MNAGDEYIAEMEAECRALRMRVAQLEAEREQSAQILDEVSIHIDQLLRATIAECDELRRRAYDEAEAAVADARDRRLAGGDVAIAAAVGSFRLHHGSTDDRRARPEPGPVRAFERDSGASDGLVAGDGARGRVLFRLCPDPEHQRAPRRHA